MEKILEEELMSQLMWQEENLSFKLVQAEQQFKKVKGELNPDTYWITAGTSQFWTPEEKLNITKMEPVINTINKLGELDNKLDEYRELYSTQKAESLFYKEKEKLIKLSSYLFFSH